MKPDEVAEWLRRWTANPLCSARVGSNPTFVGVLLQSILKVRAALSAITLAFKAHAETAR